VAPNYEAISAENRESYGTKGAQKSGQLAAGLYDDRTQFMFVLPRNAEVWWRPLFHSRSI